MAPSSPRCQCAQQACSLWKREGDGQRGPTLQLKLLVKCDDHQERTCLDTDTLHKPEANSGEMRKGRSSLSGSRTATQNHVLLWLNISQLSARKNVTKIIIGWPILHTLPPRQPMYSDSKIQHGCEQFLPTSHCLPHSLHLSRPESFTYMPGESVDTLKLRHCNRDQLTISYCRETNKLFCLQNCNETRNLIKVKTFLVISEIWNLVLRVGIWNEVLTEVVLSRFQTVGEEKWGGHRNI